MFEEPEANLTVGEIYKKLKYLINNSTSEISAKIDILTSQLLNSEKKIEALEKENQYLKRQIQENQKEKKKNNIVIFGVKEEEEENVYKIVTDLCKGNLKIEIEKGEIDYAYRFGRNSEYRPIVVRFVSLHKKLEILKNGRLLQGMNVSVTNDLTREERENNKILRRHLKQAREQQLPAKINKNKLMIGKDSYTVSELLELEKEQEIETTNKETVTTRNKPEKEKSAPQQKTTTHSTNIQTANKASSSNAQQYTQQTTGRKNNQQINYRLRIRSAKQ